MSQTIDEIKRELAQSAESFAEYFYQQCTGQWSGENTYVPNNPGMYSIFLACRAGDRKRFVAQLRVFANDIESVEAKENKRKSEDDNIPW